MQAFHLTAAYRLMQTRKPIRPIRIPTQIVNMPYGSSCGLLAGPHTYTERPNQLCAERQVQPLRMNAGIRHSKSLLVISHLSAYCNHPRLVNACACACADTDTAALMASCSRVQTRVHFHWEGAQRNSVTSKVTCQNSTHRYTHLHRLLHHMGAPLKNA